MKYTIVFICFFSILLFGCMKSQTKDSLMVQTHEQHFSVATVLADDFEDKRFAECVQWDLKNEFPKIKFIPGDSFRDALFPWFEPNTAPREKGELSAILNKTLVRERIEAIGVELLIYVHGDTNQGRFSGSHGGYGAAAGYYSAKRQTHIWTTVWDLKDNVRVGDTDVDFQGTVHIPILGFPILIPVFTESSACNETSKRISNCLKGEVSHKKKFDDR
jgi:hypothetical protein